MLELYVCFCILLLQCILLCIFLNAMVKAKKGKKKAPSTSSASSTGTPATTSTTTISGSFTLNRDANGQLTGISTSSKSKKENLDDLAWLRECELRHTATGEPYLQLEYQDDDELIILLQKFLEESAATKKVIDGIYQIWQQTVLSTLLQSSAVWKKDNVTAADQRQMKDTLKTARYKINFIMHHVTGNILTSTASKWTGLRDLVLQMCYNTLVLVPRLAESCPHSASDIRLAIIHFEGKEFLAAVACETWDTLYDFSIPIDPDKFIPVLRRCAMLDILDKDWNMLGGWEDILKGMEAKCCNRGTVHRLASDAVLHEATTILRNARNSMQCKFFSVRFMRYTEDQAPQRWRYFPKCSAPACANIETPQHPHKHRCRKCWYFHYCSAACQEYCDNIMGLHPKFCKDTPSSKAALCQKETEQYLGWTTAVPDNHHRSENRVACHSCGAFEEDENSNSGGGGGSSSTCSTKSSSMMKRCSQCHQVCYCSRQCQEWDWRVGGHRDLCKPDANHQHGGSSADVVTSSNAPVSPLENGDVIPKDLN